MKKFFTLLFLMINSFVFGQITVEEAIKPLQAGEVILEWFDTDSKGGAYRGVTLYGERIRMSYSDINSTLNNAYLYARKKYPDKQVWLRNMILEYSNSGDNYYVLGANVVSGLKDAGIKVPLNKAFDKALMNVREGSRFSIDNVTISGDITSEINKESVKDNVIDVLLDKGYKVVAKEYLERLYQEQQVQQSGIYNENTVVQENNLSAVGYFLNIKITDESLRVQVVNVSTGEYEGNATITF